MKYQFIHSQRTQHRITLMCRILDVSRSGYYDWLDRPESARSQRHNSLKEQIKAIHEENHEIYGSPRIHGELVELGEVIGENTVARLMRRLRHSIQGPPTIRGNDKLSP